MHVAAQEALDVPVEHVRVGAFTIPTDALESDATLEWSSTTIVVVELRAAETVGVGCTYGDSSLASLIKRRLEPVLAQHDVGGIDAVWRAMFAHLRNEGRTGSTAMAVSAVDLALWDLKARLLNIPLVQLLGLSRPSLPVYGSGGFTSYSDSQLQRQFLGWADQGITRFKMKVGREPWHDPHRVCVARSAIPDTAELYVDANSAYSWNEAIEAARMFVDEADVRWLEEPLGPNDFSGLRFLRGRVPPQIRLAEGEYGYDLDYFRRLIGAEAVDVVMADITRCGGISGFMKVAALCEAWRIPLSSHCAPAWHVAPGCAAGPMLHAEYFHDHVRIERELFDGVPELAGGALHPDLTRMGNGLEFKWADAERYAD